MPKYANYRDYVFSKPNYRERLRREGYKPTCEPIRPLWLSISVAILLTILVFALTGTILVFLPLTFRL